MGLNREELAWQRLGTYRTDLDEFRRLKPLLAPEVHRCFSPAVHEGHRQPYGAIVARIDDPDEFGTLYTMDNAEELRGAADGVNAVQCRRPIDGQQRHTPSGRQQFTKLRGNVRAAARIWPVVEDRISQ
jgi:hypothetical protein